MDGIDGYKVLNSFEYKKLIKDLKKKCVDYNSIMSFSSRKNYIIKKINKKYFTIIRMDTFFIKDSDTSQWMKIYFSNDPENEYPIGKWIFIL